MAAFTYKIQSQFPAVSQVTKQGYVSNVVIAANVLTVTTSAAHGITQIGTIVKIQGVSTTVDGTYLIISVTSATFNVVSATATLGSVAVSPPGVATFTPVTSGVVVANKQVVNGIATITTNTAHGYSVGDFVLVNINDAIYDNTTTGVQIIGTPTTTTFQYVVATTTAASTAVTITASSCAKTTWQGSYTVAAVTQGLSSTIYVANASAFTQYFRLYLQKGGAALANQFTAFDQAILPNTTKTFTTGVGVNTGEIITMQASSNLVTITVDGAELA
jgi:hypothetical protein